MKEENCFGEIMKKYLRTDESDLRGTNIQAMDRFIELLQLHEKNEDTRISGIGKNFKYIDKLAPNFTIFQAKDCMFMPNFKAYQISGDTNMLAASHEFGHAVLSIMNNTVVPENFGEVIGRAKQHAISTENKEYFKEYIQYICGNSENRTEAEKGPVSDIISSIFQFQGLRIGSQDNVCVLPSSHSREYYYDDKNNTPKVKNIFDEDFANYYALKVNNCTQEIETIRNLFGDEFVQVLDTELEKVYARLEVIKENESQEYTVDPMDLIKKAATYSSIGEINGVANIETEKEINGKDI